MAGALVPVAAHGYANTPPIDPSYNNRIIDDSIMLNSGSMTTNQVQAFLNQMVPTCDTNHQGGAPSQPPPYVCLKDYVDTTVNKTAAQIIHDEAASIGLNPQAVLVTLEKEESLVTDTWPYPSQYRTAMGYGCPESQSVCDSQYYGFYNQVHLGARLLRAGIARDCGDTNTLSGWYVSPQWKVGQSPAVDGVPTYLASCSTGSLYNYTPHRPDSAYTARGNNCGTTHDQPCYYYGNYNFIKFWTSWFGPTTRAYLGRSTSSPQVYLINDSDKYPINSQDILNTYSIFGPVKTFTDGFIASLNPRSVAGRVVAGPDSTVYLLDSGNKIPFSSCAMLDEYGLGCSGVLNLPQNVIDGFMAGPVATNVVRSPNGSIFQMAGGKKHGVPDMATYTGSGLDSTPVTGLGSDMVGQFADGSPVLLDNVIALDKNSHTAYLHIGSTNYPVSSMAAFMNWKFDTLPYYSFPGALITQITTGAAVTDFATSSGGAKYLLNKKQKLPLGGASGEWSANFTALPDALLNAVPTGSAPSQVIKGSDATIWHVENKTRRPFASWQDFQNSGFHGGDILAVDDANVNALPQGPLKLGPLALMKQPGNGTVAMVTGAASAKLVGAPAMAGAWGLSLASTRTVDAATWNAYSPSGLLSQLATDGSLNFLMDLGIRSVFASNLLTNYGYTGSSFQSLPAAAALVPGNRDMTEFVKGSGGTIYHVEGGTKRPFASWAGYTSAGGNSSNTLTLSDLYLGSIPTGAGLP